MNALFASRSPSKIKYTHQPKAAVPQKYSCQFFFLTMRVQHFLYAIILFAGLFSSGCQQQPTLPGSSSLQLEVVKEITLSPEVAEHLGNVVDRIPASPSEDLLALTNARSPIHIVVVDYNGDLVEVVGSEGRGPEELLWPRYFGFDQENNIVVYDNDLALFKVFKHSSGSVSSYSPPSIQDMQIKGEGYFEGTCKDKWYILTSSFSGIIDDSTPIVGIFSKEFELLHTMGRYDPLFVERSETPSVCRTIRNSFGDAISHPSN